MVSLCTCDVTSLVLVLLGSICRELGTRLSTVGSGSLRIDSLQLEDAGLYTCRATNQDDSIDAVATLTVHGGTHAPSAALILTVSSFSAAEILSSAKESRRSG